MVGLPNHRASLKTASPNIPAGTNIEAPIFNGNTQTIIHPIFQTYLCLFAVELALVVAVRMAERNKKLEMESQNQHTPGPYGEQYGRIFAQSAPHGTIARGVGIDGELLPNWEANRLLFTAAPELLEALESAEEYWIRGNPALVKQCRAAIARATGQNQVEK